MRGLDEREALRFGRHVQSLRAVRGLTQEGLAERCGLSPDTIRRIERGMFSPSLPTLRRLAVGLELSLITLFESLDVGAVDGSREILDLLATRTGNERVLGLALLRALFELLDRLGVAIGEEPSERDESPVSDPFEKRERHAGVRQFRKGDGTG